MQRSILLTVLVCSLMACSLFENKGFQSADLLITNGTIYTVDKQQPTAEAVLVNDGIISYVGDLKGAISQISSTTKVIDLRKQTMIPGFIESHGHLVSLGYSLNELDLSQVKNYDQLLQQVQTAVSKAAKGDWILGHSWHQSKWDALPEQNVKGFQTNRRLNRISPHNPVLLKHSSGHALFVNEAALKIAGISAATQFDSDGEIIKDVSGNPTGILTENAQNLIYKIVPKRRPIDDRNAVSTALRHLSLWGITSFQDAGTEAHEIAAFQTFREENLLTARLYIMLAGWEAALLDSWLPKGPAIDDRHWLTIRAIKLVADGALGSRGAWLLSPYSDRAGHLGNPTMPMETIGAIARRAIDRNFQVAVHAIGDRANRELLDQYEPILSTAKVNPRFRIEHAQHLHPSDIPRFGQLGVIASMQGIHMSSDRPWAIHRLGHRRIIEGAYVWRKLLDSGAVLINGTDTPVEPVNPIASFYSLVTRKRLDGTPEGGYEPQQKLSRVEALRAYTLDAAYGAFEETIKGSIEVGKLADFTILSQDILKVKEEQLLNVRVIRTIVGGKSVYWADKQSADTQTKAERRQGFQ